MIRQIQIDIKGLQNVEQITSAKELLYNDINGESSSNFESILLPNTYHFNFSSVK